MRLPGDIDTRAAWAVFMANATSYRRTWKANMLPNFFEPLLYLLGMGIGLGHYLSDGMEGQDYLAFIAPGLCAAAAMNGASFETTYNMFVKLRFSRLYDAYLSTPALVQDIVFGEFMWAVARALIYGLAFLIVMFGVTLAGYPLLASPWAIAMPLALALVGATFALCGELFTAIIDKIDLYSYYFTLWITPLFLFSGIFFPVDRFPYGAEIAWMTPLYHAVRLCRGLCQGPMTAEVAISAAWLVAVSLALQWAALTRMRKRLWV